MNLNKILDNFFSESPSFRWLYQGGKGRRLNAEVSNTKEYSPSAEVHRKAGDSQDEKLHNTESSDSSDCGCIRPTSS